MSYKRPEEYDMFGLTPHWGNSPAGEGYGISICRFSETLGKLIYNCNVDTPLSSDSIKILFKLHYPICYYWRVDP